MNNESGKYKYSNWLQSLLKAITSIFLKEKKNLKKQNPDSFNQYHFERIKILQNDIQTICNKTAIDNRAHLTLGVLRIAKRIMWQICEEYCICPEDDLGHFNPQITNEYFNVLEWIFTNETVV
jgi:hypothetical protein